ncbi:MAG TPA: glycosyl hydrolase, partial [Gammaproteobacteria bacterium]
MNAARKVVPGRCALALAALLLGACEAPLDLAGVERESQQPVRRYDQFQSATQVGDTVVVVGSHGAVLSSADGGRSWQRRELAGAPLLTEVVGCPDGSLAALDERRQVWLSGDRGGSWEARPLEGPEMPLALTCDPAGRLWAVGTFSTIWSSGDRGASWQQQSLGEDVLLNTVQFTD